MNAETFMKLVDDNDGFEFVIGYKDFVDHSIGGKGNKYWYYVDYNGKKAEYYVGTYENGFWSDVFYSKKGSSLTSKTATSGTAIKKIVEKAYLCQEKIGTKKPSEVEKYGYTCYHYMFGFGQSACAVSKDYGITVDYNNIDDNDSAYHLREILLGADVEKPREN